MIFRLGSAGVSVISNTYDIGFYLPRALDVALYQSECMVILKIRAGLKPGCLKEVRMAGGT